MKKKERKQAVGSCSKCHQNGLKNYYRPCVYMGDQKDDEAKVFVDLCEIETMPRGFLPLMHPDSRHSDASSWWVEIWRLFIIKFCNL